MSHLRPHATVLSLEQQNREILKKFDRDKKAGGVLTGIGGRNLSGSAAECRTRQDNKTANPRAVVIWVS